MHFLAFSISQLKIILYNKLNTKTGFLEKSYTVITQSNFELELCLSSCLLERSPNGLASLPDSATNTRAAYYRVVGDCLKTLAESET